LGKTKNPKSVHDQYADKLKEIGEKLGFTTEKASKKLEKAPAPVLKDPSKKKALLS